MYDKEMSKKILLKRILFLVLGITEFALAALSFLVPEECPEFCGVGLIVFGLGSSLNWYEKWRAGANKYTYINMPIFSLFTGLFIFLGSIMDVLVFSLIWIAMVLWTVVTGIMEALCALDYRKAMTTSDLGCIAPGAIPSLCLAFIRIFFGFMSIYAVLSALPTREYFLPYLYNTLGITMLISAIRLLAAVGSAGYLEVKKE
jgi:hypothetical protein